jgi:hypothetical protein
MKKMVYRDEIRLLQHAAGIMVSSVHQRSRLLYSVCGISVVAATLFYLFQWLDMPLYPDEVALRLQKARYFADGAISFGLFPCPSNAQPIPIIFRPAA